MFAGYVPGSAAVVQVPFRHRGRATFSARLGELARGAARRWRVSLLGWPLLVLLGVLMVALPVATVALWTRVGGPRPVRTGARLSLVGLSRVTAVVFVAAALNDYGYFYASWSDLFGQSSPV